MKYFIKRLKEFTKDENGASTVEYGFLVVLVAVVLIAIVNLIGANLGIKFDAVADTVNQH